MDHSTRARITNWWICIDIACTFALSTAVFFFCTGAVVTAGTAVLCCALSQRFLLDATVLDPVARFELLNLLLCGPI